MGLGAHIRTFRLRRGLTGRELARRAAVSTSLVSQIEREVSTPSVEVLRRIAAALEIRIGALFDGPDADGSAAPVRAGRARLVRRGERKVISLPASGVRYELLSPDLQGRLEFILAEYGPGEATAPVGFSHEGEESWHVLQGIAHFYFGEALYVLEAGDTITFDSSVPHRAVNPGDTPLIAITAGTPPSF